MASKRTLVFALLAIVALCGVGFGYVWLFSRSSQMASAQSQFEAKMAREGRHLPTAEDRRKLALRRGQARREKAALDAWYADGKDDEGAAPKTGPAPPPHAFGDPVLAVDRPAPRPALVLGEAATDKPTAAAAAN